VENRNFPHKFNAFSVSFVVIKDEMLLVILFGNFLVAQTDAGNTAFSELRCDARPRPHQQQITEVDDADLGHCLPI
jgi:hypothetical protein